MTSIILPPVLSTATPITIKHLLEERRLGAVKLEICSVMLSGVYQPKREKTLSVGRKIYNIKRAINYHEKKGHRDDILKIYYTRLIAQFSDGVESVLFRTEDLLRDEQKFFTTTLFSTLLLDVVELQAHFNLLHCIADYQAYNHPDNLQLTVYNGVPQSISELFELLPFPRSLLSESVKKLEGTRFRIYTNITELATRLYCLERGKTIEELESDKITYRAIPKGHILSFDYKKIPYEYRNKKTRSEVIEYVVSYDDTQLFETYSKIKPWTSTISQFAAKYLTCCDKIKASAAGIRLQLDGCSKNLCICKTALFRRMQLLDGSSDLDFQKLIATYRFCAYALTLERRIVGRQPAQLDYPATSLAFTGRVIPWHAINRQH